MQNLSNQSTNSDFRNHAYVERILQETENDLASARKVVALLIRHLDREHENNDLTIEYLHRVAERLDSFMNNEIKAFEADVIIECTHTISKFRKLQSLIEDATEMTYDLIRYAHSDIIGNKHIQSLLQNLQRKLDLADTLESDILYMRYDDISASD